MYIFNKRTSAINSTKVSHLKLSHYSILQHLQKFNYAHSKWKIYNSLNAIISMREMIQLVLIEAPFENRPTSGKTKIQVNHFWLNFAALPI